MRVEIADTPLADVEADLHAVAVFDDEAPPSEVADAPGADDVRAAYKELTLLRPGRPPRLLVVGLGKREELEPERLRVAAALAERRGRRYDARSLAWALPGSGDDPRLAAALVEGTILASYRFDRFRSDPERPEPPSLERLALAIPPESERAGLEAAVRVAEVAAEAANRTRELQNLPPNVLTPGSLADRARQLSAQHERIAVEVLGREEIVARGMGGLAAVSAGSAQEPQLIALRYSGADGGDALGLVGKAVTFDAGGISIKPAAKMHEMKMDMSGGAAVIEALAAIAELGLGVDVAAAVPATENMPSGTATRPGDIVTQLNGKTVEIVNTDAEGRLILADALTYCVRDQGATRLVDLATLTGTVTLALGSTYAGLISNDDEWAARVGAACERAGELAWRLPLHPEYKELTRGTVADLTNASSQRKASTIYAASFLEEFTDGVPWAHLDIAGTAWDVGREYVGKGPTGIGVRLLVELARDLAS